MNKGQNTEMENTNIQNNLEIDKQLVDRLFSKEALNNFEENNSNVPSNYFEKFELKVINNIHSSKQPAPIIKITKWGRFAIAASFLTVIVSSYLFFLANSSNHETNNHESESIVNLQEIPNSEIDAYVNTNEWVAEIDWQEEINIESTHLDNLGNHLIKDSNNTQ